MSSDTSRSAKTDDEDSDRESAEQRETEQTEPIENTNSDVDREPPTSDTQREEQTDSSTQAETPTNRTASDTEPHSDSLTFDDFVNVSESVENGDLAPAIDLSDLDTDTIEKMNELAADKRGWEEFKRELAQKEKQAREENDYASIPIPTNKPTAEYDYKERRAAIYRMIERAGHPKRLEYSQSDLGDRYGVSQRQIYKDIQRLKTYEYERIGKDEEVNTSFLAQRAVQGALEEKDYREALEIQLEYYGWLFDSGHKQKAADKQVNVDMDAEQAWRMMFENQQG